MNQNQQTQKKSPLIIGIIIAFILSGMPVFLYFMGLKPFPYSATFIFFNEIYYWFVLMVLFVYVTRIEKQKYLIWDEKNYPLTYYLKSVFKTLGIMFIGMMIIGVLLKISGINDQSDKMSKIIQILHKHKILIILISLTAGITEELIFRAYMLTRLEMLIKKPAMSILISAVLFGILHISYGTVGQILGPLFLGIIFAAHYYRFRNIKIIIICHFVWNLLSLYIKAH